MSLPAANDINNKTNANNEHQLNDKDVSAILDILKTRISEWRTTSLDHVLQHHVVNAFDYSPEAITKRIDELQNEYHLRHRRKDRQWRWYQVFEDLEKALTEDNGAEQEDSDRVPKRRKTDRFLEEEIETFMDYWREGTSTINPTTKRITDRYLEEKEKQKSDDDYESTWVWFDVIDKFIQKHNINLSDFSEKRAIEQDEDWLNQDTKTVIARGTTYIEQWMGIASEFLHEQADKTRRDTSQLRKFVEDSQRLFEEKIAKDSGLI